MVMPSSLVEGTAGRVWSPKVRRGSEEVGEVSSKERATDFFLLMATCLVVVQSKSLFSVVYSGPQSGWPLLTTAAHVGSPVSSSAGGVLEGVAD